MRKSLVLSRPARRPFEQRMTTASFVKDNHQLVCVTETPQRQGDEFCEYNIRCWEILYFVMDVFLLFAAAHNFPPLHTTDD